jgi:predicted AlkP superfamily phosphohydrolase/phosphomutase
VLPSDRRPVLAIGIDAAEPTLVRTLMAQNELPALGRLLAEGTWSRVTSPADIGSGAVWPTFITGTDPDVHGVCGEWPWQPDAMDIGVCRPQSLTPFWADLARRGLTVGVLDVPFAPLVGLSRGFEISEWGAHDALEGRPQIGPAAVEEGVVKRFGSHPFSSRRPDASGPDDHDALSRLSADCLAGVTRRGRLTLQLLAATRPDLAIVVFPEVHTASHHLWHTVTPTDPLYADERYVRAPAVEPSLLDVLREVDRQIGDLVAAVGPEAPVAVFGLHGMRPTHGIPTLLDPLLRAAGFARGGAWRTQSWPERARSVFAAAKRRAPARLKTLYYRAMSRGIARRLAQTTMLARYDWEHTRAFALPSDQHGWIRVNLAGREARGIVPPERYATTCGQLVDLLSSLTTDDGRPVVREVVQPGRAHGGAPPRRLPDLVVHWHDAAFDDPVRLRQPSIIARPTGTKFSGQHAPDGFCLTRGIGASFGPSLATRDLHRVITEPLR